MQGDAFKIVKRGDPLGLSAEAWNNFIETAKIVAGQRHDQRAGGGPFPTLRSVLVQNKTGGDLDVCSVVGLGDPLFAPDGDSLTTFQQQIGFEGNAPTADQDEGYFGITVQPLAVDEIGLAVVDGVVPVQIAVNDPDHLYAEIRAADTGKLDSVLYGSAQILWRDGGEGTVWAVVRLGAPVSAPGVMQACLVWQDGGTTDGDLTHQCDRTYTVRTLDATAVDAGGKVLGTELSPLEKRRSIGKYVTPPADGAGVVGIGYFDGSGTFVLFSANEVVDPTADCA